jgi:hypothetical protein
LVLALAMVLALASVRPLETAPLQARGWVLLPVITQDEELELALDGELELALDKVQGAELGQALDKVQGRELEMVPDWVVQAAFVVVVCHMRSLMKPAVRVPVLGTATNTSC